MSGRGSTAWNQLAAALTEAAPDAVIAVDAEGIIRFASAEAERVFGYSREELVGGPFEILVPQLSRAAHAIHVAAYLANPRARAMGAGLQLEGQRSDGSTFPADISLAPVTSPEGLIVAAVVRDVTDRVAMEAERERLRALAERERQELRIQQAQRFESLGQLAGGIAHDFGNLMAVILNYVSIIRDDLSEAARGAGSAPWDAVGDEVAQIEVAAQAGTRLTHQLTAFARQGVPTPEMVDLNRVILDLERLLGHSLGPRVRVITALAENLAPLLADVSQIEQVLVNLAVNARDAMPGGGTLKIQTENFMVDDAHALAHPQLHPGPHVLLRVSDNGVGMSPEVRERASEPFFTTKARGQGSGLGLATVFGIVLQWGGEIGLYSEPGLGTTFAALIPAPEEARPHSQRTARRRPRAGGETVLIADADQATREVGRRMLERHGDTVLAASDESQALDRAASGAAGVDILLTETALPGMRGAELAERIRAIRPSVRTVFLSGHPREFLEEKGWLAAGAELIEKPFTEAALLSTIRRALGDREPQP